MPGRGLNGAPPAGCSGQRPGLVAQALGLGPGGGGVVPARLLVGAHDGPGSGDEPGGAARGPGRGEVLDPSALRADARQQEDRARQQLPGAGQVLGRGGTDDRADVVQPALRSGLAGAVDHAGDVLPDGLAALEPGVLHVGGAGVGGAHEDEEAGAARPGGVDEGLEGVGAHVGADGEEVGAEALDVAEGRRGRGEQALRVGGGGDVDVAALGVGDDQEAEGAGVGGGVVQRLPAGRAEALEARDLELDRDDRGGDGVQDGAAVGGDGGRRADGGSAVSGLARGIAGGPEPRRVGVQAEDDLGPPLGDGGGQPVGDVVADRPAAGCLVGGQGAASP